MCITEALWRLGSGNPVTELHTLLRYKIQNGHGQARLSDHIDRSVGQGSYVEVTVGAADDVGNDPEILPGHQAPALALVELVVVIIDPVLQFWVAEREVPSAVVELEFEEIPFVEECPRGTDKQISGMLRSERGTREADGRRSDGPFPTELGALKVRAGQDE
jgi:hypothetical protein